MRRDMLPIILSAVLGILAAAALAVLTAGSNKSKRVNLRFAALNREDAPRLMRIRSPISGEVSSG